MEELTSSPRDWSPLGVIIPKNCGERAFGLFFRLFVQIPHCTRTLWAKILTRKLGNILPQGKEIPALVADFPGGVVTS